MDKIKGFIIKLLAKPVTSTVAGKVETLSIPSKTKLTAVIGVILAAIGPISAAWGHPIVIPEWVYQILAAIGLWSLRDGISTK